MSPDYLITPVNLKFVRLILIQVMNKDRKVLSRRIFIESLAKLAVAHTTVYVVGSGFKELGGSFVAGAKCSPPGPAPSCVPASARRCCPGPPDYWLCYNGC